MPPERGDELDAQRNILFLFTDQHRQDAVGAYGSSAIDTPNIDRLAGEGSRFERAYTPSAICSPARASVVSGVRPTVHGVTRNANQGMALADEFPCYPRLLRDAGYNVGHVGKWHVGQSPNEFGLDGEHYYGYMPPLEHPDYVSYLDTRGLPRWNEEAVGERFPPDAEEYLIGCVDDRPVEATFTHFIAERTIERLDEYADNHPEQPFYLGVHFFGPHRPYFLPQRYFEMYDPAEIELPESAVKERFKGKPAVQLERYLDTDLEKLSVREWRKIVAIYRGYVAFIDDEIGRLLDAVDSHDLAANTSVFFSADHGSFATAHKNVDKGPMMYEDIYKVPMIATGLGAVDVTTDTLVSLLDLAPTFLDLAGVDIPDIYEGRSLRGLFQDSDEDQAMPEWRDAITAEFHGLNFPYEQRMICTDRYKFVLNAADVDELYDLDVDPHELHNQIDDSGYTEVRKELYDRLKADFESVDDAVFPGRRLLYPASSYDYYPKRSDEE